MILIVPFFVTVILNLGATIPFQECCDLSAAMARLKCPMHLLQRQIGKQLQLEPTLCMQLLPETAVPGRWNHPVPAGASMQGWTRKGCGSSAYSGFALPVPRSQAELQQPFAWLSQRSPAVLEQPFAQLEMLGAGTPRAC